MNHLGYKIHPENGLSVELFIDGKSINDIFDAGDPFLPYWYFEDDLPYYPPYRKYGTDSSRRLIGVCDCGEYGCGNITCCVEKQNSLIVWSDFRGDLSGDQNVYKFVFDESQYIKTISQVVEIVDEYKTRKKANNSGLNLKPGTQMTTAAFFDVDGTLYTANMWRGLMEYVAAHGRKTRARAYYYKLLPLYLLYKLHLVNQETARKPWVTDLGWLVQGWSAAQGNAAFRWVAEQYIRPTARDDIIAKLHEHRAQGHAVFLVSAMLEPTLRVIGDGLGATGVIGTSIETKDGRLTGVVSPRVCMGVEKKWLTHEHLQAHGIAVDFAASYAYADSISDMDLFGMVGHPIAVYPDKQLAAHARANKWKILPNV